VLTHLAIRHAQVVVNAESPTRAQPTCRYRQDTGPGAKIFSLHSFRFRSLPKGRLSNVLTDWRDAISIPHVVAGLENHSASAGLIDFANSGIHIKRPTWKSRLIPPIVKRPWRGFCTALRGHVFHGTPGRSLVLPRFGSCERSAKVSLSLI
jgi:hypothetical protein